MSLKVTIHKENAIGEKLQFETTVPYRETSDEADIYEALLPVFRAMDRRQFELNLRVLTINQKTGELTPEEFAKFQRLLAAFNNILIELPAAAEAEVTAQDNGDAIHG